MPRPRPLPVQARIVPGEHPELDAEVMKIVKEICPAEDERTPDEVRQDEYDAYLAVIDLLRVATPRPRSARASILALKNYPLKQERNCTCTTSGLLNLGQARMKPASRACASWRL
jgi:hypothetical protein